MTNHDAIRTETLGKTFPGEVEAVRDVTLSVHEGEVYGFLGPNGAGKTTTMSMLTTLLRPTRGRAEVAGIDVNERPEAVRRRIGLVFQRSTADGGLTGRENVEIAAGLHGLSRSEARPRIREVLEKMDLTDAADRRVSTYSGGMQRRLELAVGTVHRPEILFLDEPTLGLDPQGRAGFWEYIRELRGTDGTTIFVTTHYLDEADQLADRVSIVDHGRIVITGSPSELKDRLGGDVVALSIASDADLTPVLTEVPGVLSVASGNRTFRVKAARGEALVPLLVNAVTQTGVEMRSVSIHKPSLDEVFLEMTGRAYREEGDPNGHGNGRDSYRGGDA